MKSRKSAGQGRSRVSLVAEACAPLLSTSAPDAQTHAPEPRNAYCALKPWFPPASHSGLCAPSSALIPNLACISRAQPPDLASHRLDSSLSLIATHRLDALHLALAACRLEQGRGVSGRGCTRAWHAASAACLTIHHRAHPANYPANQAGASRVCAERRGRGWSPSQVPLRKRRLCWRCCTRPGMRASSCWREG